jgi:hypothetical protein
MAPCPGFPSASRKPEADQNQEPSKQKTTLSIQHADPSTAVLSATSVGREPTNTRAIARRPHRHVEYNRDRAIPLTRR